MPVNNPTEIGNRDVTINNIIFNNENAGGNYWLTSATLTTARSGSSSFTLGGYMFTTCGINSSSIRTTSHEAYSDVTNVWLAKTNFNLTAVVGNIGFSLSLGYSGFGGTPTDQATLSGYNEITNAWTTKTSAATARRNHCASSLNGFGYVPQGIISSTLTNVNERYDETANVWTTKAAASLSVDEQTVLTAGGFLISAFGRINISTTNTATSIAYNDSTNAWTTISTSSGTVRSGVSGFTSSGIVNVATGRTPGSLSVLSDNDRLDMTTRTWTIRAPHSASSNLGVGASLNGNGYVIGGQSGSGNGISSVTQYRNYHLYTINASIKKMTDIPKMVIPSITVDGQELYLPVRLRTDGTNWRNAISGYPVKTLLGETLHVVFGPSANGVKNYEAQIGIPNFTAGLGAGVWMTKAAGTSKYRGAGLSLNGFGYNVSGRDGGDVRTNTVFRYDDYLDSWISRGSVSSSRSAPMGFDLNGVGYVAGGSPADSSVSSTVEQYNDESNSWVSKTSMSTARQAGIGHSLGSFGYIIAGTTVDTPSGDSVVNEQYNDTTNAWTTKTAMSTARRFLVSFAVSGMSYACTGVNAGSTILGTNEQYNDANNAWITKTAAATATFGAFGFTVDNKGHVIMGSTGSYTSALQQYDDITNVWNSKLPHTGTLRSQGQSMSLDKSGYTSCGYVVSPVSEHSKYTVLRSREQIQFALDMISAPLIIAPNGTWTARTANPTVRSGAASMGVSDKLLTVGGFDGSSTLSSAHLYDNALNSWTATGAVSQARSHPSPFIIGSLSGIGYVVGGFNNGSTIYNNLDKYDFTLSTWSARTVLPTSKWSMGSGGTSSSGYAVGGGINNAGGLVKTVHKYNDTANTWTAMSDFPALIRDSASFTSNSSIHVTHGYSPDTSTVTGKSYVYNESFDVWIALTTANTARGELAGFSVSGSGFAAVGASDAGGTLSSALDEYLIGANIWMSRTANSQARRLTSGGNNGLNGYVVGGFTGSRVATTDRYNA